MYVSGHNFNSGLDCVMYHKSPRIGRTFLLPILPLKIQCGLSTGTSTMGHHHLTVTGWLLVETPIINAIGYLYTKGDKPPLSIIAINK